jgi:hypothetical protein
MKKSLLFAALCIAMQITNAQVNDPGQVAKDGATNHANNDMSSGVDNGLNKTENALKGLFKKKKPASAAAATSTAAPATSTSGTAASGVSAAGTGASGTGSAASSGPVTLTTYSNYDFVPGDKIIFGIWVSKTQDSCFFDRRNRRVSTGSSGLPGRAFVLSPIFRMLMAALRSLS